MNYLKFLGLATCFFLILGALFEIGIFLYIDIYSFLIVTVRAIGYSLIKNNKKEYIPNFGSGAVFFGWLGALIGLITLNRGKYNNWGDINKMGAAFAVLLLPVFYGYIIKLITTSFSK
ncbi:hypothetical protein N9T15_00880 [Pelagibacteraceae bacterium]|nr:hypothetical protein [Pelagibacteraceae bacterium]